MKIPKVILICVLPLLLSSCDVCNVWDYFVTWQTEYPDNKIEIICEDMIESITGIKTDLTLLSPEEDNRWQKENTIIH